MLNDIIKIFAIFFLLFSSANASDDLVKSYEIKLQKGEFQKALQEIIPLAKGGDAYAQYTLGAMYARGDGLEQDFVNAFKWYSKSAEQGLSIAQNMVGVIYSIGQGTPKNIQKAREFYLKAADQGFALAQTNLGCMFKDGIGLDQNYQEADDWYRKAAEQDEPGAQHNLGMMYYQGLGVQQDILKSYEWFVLAFENGSKQSIEMITKVKRFMNPEQIKIVQERIRKRKMNRQKIN